MKKKTVTLAALAVLALALLAAGLVGRGRGGDVSQVQTSDAEPSEIYLDAEIEDAYQTVKAYFRRGFSGCTLTRLYYPGDGYAAECEEWAGQYGAEKAIVLLSSFEVDPSGGDGSLEPGATYDNWAWVLVRDSGGSWRHVTHGYG